MPKNQGLGGKNFRKGLKGKTKQSIGSTDVNIKKEEGQEYGIVTKVLGSCNVNVYCMDGLTRVCHIRGSMTRAKNRVFVGLNDIILISIRDFQNDKGDVVRKYNDEEVSLLKSLNEIDFENVGKSVSKEVMIEDNSADSVEFTFEEI